MAAPVNGLVDALLTDQYQLSMAYAYWKAGRHDEAAVFDLFFRKNAFGGAFTVTAGLAEALAFLSAYRFTAEHVAHVRTLFGPAWDEAFGAYLATVDCSRVLVYALAEGSAAFPLVPLLRVEGPLAVCQLLETTLLTLVNYPSLVATNAARIRLAADARHAERGREGEDGTVAPITLLEFGLRRAQGPDGGVSASRYAYIGGFDGTSNVRAGVLFGIPVKGTHAHAFVSSFRGRVDLPKNTLLAHAETGERADLWASVNDWRAKVPGGSQSNDGELVAFTAYALAFPGTFLALIDTYHTLHSGLVNFAVLALALHDFGYRVVGIRLDSGDLAYLSVAARVFLSEIANIFALPWLKHVKICASSDLNEDVIYALNAQHHEIDVFGVGTNLVTCEKQPALGCVYKLVEVNGAPRIKLSNNVGKVTIPCAKAAYRLFGHDGPVIDLLTLRDEPPPQPGEGVLCRHPFEGTKRAKVRPVRVEVLHTLVWDGKATMPTESIVDVRARCLAQVHALREDHRRPVNPTPYKVALSEALYRTFHDLWLHESPVEELT